MVKTHIQVINWEIQYPACVTGTSSTDNSSVTGGLLGYSGSAPGIISGNSRWHHLVLQKVTPSGGDAAGRQSSGAGFGAGQG